jgi:CheY-like chemotaxis protein
MRIRLETHLLIVTQTRRVSAMTDRGEINDYGETDGHAETGASRVLEVLIADDDEAATELIAEALYPAKVWTTTGEEALQKIRSGNPASLLIASLELSGRYDGIALARQARALRPELKIIYTSAYRQRLPEDDQTRYYGELLGKPLTVEHVRAAAERALDPNAV